MQGENFDSSGFYRDALWLDDDTIVALRSDINLDFALIIEHIENGQVVRQVGPMEDVFGLFLASDGFFTTSSPDFYTARITKMSAEGEPLWRIDWDEWINFNGILTQGDVHVAFGSKTIKEGDISYDPTSVVVAFNDQGSILWRHDSLSPEEFIGGVWTDQGQLLLVGDAWPKGDSDTPGRFVYSFIAQYNEDGQVWRTEYRHTNEGKPGGGHVQSVIPTQGGCLIVISQSERYWLKMLYCGYDGNLIQEWYEFSYDPYHRDSATLYQVNERIYLLTDGRDMPRNAKQKKNFSLIPRSILLREIKIPQ